MKKLLSLKAAVSKQIFEIAMLSLIIASGFIWELFKHSTRHVVEIAALIVCDLVILALFALIPVLIVTIAPPQQRESTGARMEVGSWIAIVFVTILSILVAWAFGTPYDIGGAIAKGLVSLLIPFAIAYLVRGRKKNWDSFARWFFWLALLFICLANNHRA